MSIKADLAKKLSLSPKEISKFKIQGDAEGRIQWSKEGIDYLRQYTFTEAEMTLIRKQLNALGEKKELRDDLVSLVHWFVENKDVSYDLQTLDEPEELKDYTIPIEVK